MTTLERIQGKHDYAMAELTKLADEELEGDERREMLAQIESAGDAFTELINCHSTLKNSLRELIDAEETA